MNMQVLPSPELLHKLLKYDGKQLFWRERTPEMFESGYRTKEGNCANWNSIYSGKLAGTVHKRGYVYVNYKGKKHLAHRIIWAMETGEWPIDIIDHEDGNSSNNDFLNMRDVTQSVNMKNAKRSKANSSGVTGVSWRKDTKSWSAEIMVDGNKIYLGSYKNLADAKSARKTAEVRNNFHPNHGRIGN